MNQQEMQAALMQDPGTPAFQAAMAEIAEAAAFIAAWEPSADED